MCFALFRFPYVRINVSSDGADTEWTNIMSDSVCFMFVCICVYVRLRGRVDVGDGSRIGRWVRVAMWKLIPE